MMRVVLFLSTVAVAMGACDNFCSGHGTCGKNGVCECYDNWGLGLSHDSGDCSDRICPYDFAWVDNPDNNGRFHKYAECSGQGICARDTGSCECFPGYEGKACQRQTCPNSCSGHGRCQYIENLGYATTPFDFAGLRGIDGDNSEEAKYFTTAWGGVGTQQVGTVLGTNDGGYIAGAADTRRRRLNTFVDYSKGPLQISYDGTSNMDMMGGVLPGDFFEQEPYNKFPFHHWDKSKSTSCVCDPEWGDFDCSKRMCPYGNDVMDHRNNMARAARYQVQSIELFANEEITGGSSATNYENADTAASPLTHLRTFALTFKSKLNETFTTIPIVLITEHTGFHNFIKSVKDALESLPNRVIDRVDVAGDTNGVDLVHLNLTFTGEHVQGPQNLVSVKANLCGDGCTPKLTGLELRNQWETILEVQNSDFNSFECGRRGKCDYTTGVCNCFEGYTGLACNTITALVQKVFYGMCFLPEFFSIVLSTSVFSIVSVMVDRQGK